MKGASMNRSLLVLMLSAFAAPGFSMTATVSSSSQPVAAPAAPGIASVNATPKATAAPAAAISKSAMPNAATVTRPSVVLSAPGLMSKGNDAVSAKSSASKPRAILPVVAPTANAPAAVPATWRAVSAQSNAMHGGRVDAISAGAGTVQVFGEKLTFNAQRVKVFNRDGSGGSIFGLKSGDNVRFTLDPADSKRRRVAVIYVN